MFSVYIFTSFGLNRKIYTILYCPYLSTEDRVSILVCDHVLHSDCSVSEAVGSSQVEKKRITR